MKQQTSIKQNSAKVWNLPDFILWGHQLSWQRVFNALVPSITKLQGHISTNCNHNNMLLQTTLFSWARKNCNHWESNVELYSHSTNLQHGSWTLHGRVYLLLQIYESQESLLPHIRICKQLDILECQRAGTISIRIADWAQALDCNCVTIACRDFLFIEIGKWFLCHCF